MEYEDVHYEDYAPPAQRITSTEINIKKYDLPPQVAEYAIENLIELQQKEKGSRYLKQTPQNEAIFACIFKAYYMNSTPIDPIFLGKMLGFSKMKFSHNNAINKYLSDIDLNPQDLVNFYIDSYIDKLERNGYETFDRDVVVCEIIDFINDLLIDTDENYRVHEWIECTSVRNVTIGITTFYLTEIYNCPFSSKIWSDSVYLTPACIKKYKNKFREHYNNT